MKETWLYFLGVVLMSSSFDAGTLVDRGFRFPGTFLVILLQMVTTVCWLAGFFVGPWWGPFAVVPAVIILVFTWGLLLGKMSLKIPPELELLVRFYAGILLGIVGATCIGMWFY